MRISTHQFLLGSLNDLLAQQNTANQLNRQIASGQTLLDAGDDPAAAGQALTVASAISQLSYSTANAQAAQQSAQTGIGALQQVSTVLSQLQQIASQAASAATTPQQRSALSAQAQSAFDQLVQLGNTQDAGGNYIFAGSRTRQSGISAAAGRQRRFCRRRQYGQIDLAPFVERTPRACPGRMFSRAFRQDPAVSR